MFTRSVQDFFLIALVVTTAAGYNPAASNAGNLRGAHILHSFTEGSSKLSHFFREVLHPSRIDISTSSIPGMGPAPTYRYVPVVSILMDDTSLSGNLQSFLLQASFRGLRPTGRHDTLFLSCDHVSFHYCPAYQPGGSFSHL